MSVRSLFIVMISLALAACNAPDGASSRGTDSARTGAVVPLKHSGIVDTGESATQRTMRMAERAMADGKPDVALTFYRSAALADPKNPAPRLASAALFEKTGEYGAAAGMYRQVASEQKDTDAWLAAGRNYLKAGKPDEAGAAYQVAIAELPKDARGYNGLAVSHDLRQEHEKAAPLYEKAYDLADRQMGNGILVNWGLSLMLAGQPEKAVELLEPAQRRDDLPSLRQTLGLAYGLTGQPEKAKEMGVPDAPSQEQLKATVREYGMGGPTGAGPQAAPRGAVTGDAVTIPAKR